MQLTTDHSVMRNLVRVLCVNILPASLIQHCDNTSAMTTHDNTTDDEHVTVTWPTGTGGVGKYGESAFKNAAVVYSYVYCTRTSTVLVHVWTRIQLGGSWFC